MEAEAVQAGVTIVAPILPPESDGLLLQAIIEPGDKAKEGMLVRAVALPWFDILKGIQRDPDFLYQFARHPGFSRNSLLAVITELATKMSF